MVTLLGSVVTKILSRFPLSYCTFVLVPYSLSVLDISRDSMKNLFLSLITRTLHGQWGSLFVYPSFLLTLSIEVS